MYLLVINERQLKVISFGIKDLNRIHEILCSRRVPTSYLE
jgi:hypothetical protein